MDILSNLTNLLGDAAGGQGGRQSSGGMGSLGALAGLLGGGAGQGAASGGGDALGGLGSLVGALLGGGGSRGGGASMLSGLAGMAMGGSGAAGGAGGLGGIASLIGSLMGGQGGSMLGSLLGGGEAPPPAPYANRGDSDATRAVNTLRALVYAAKSDGKFDAQEKESINREVQKIGLAQEGQRLVQQLLNEDVDPNQLARSITSPEEALQIYALSCAITRADTFMEKNYLEALANALRIPPQAKSAIEQRVTGA